MTSGFLFALILPFLQVSGESQMPPPADEHLQYWIQTLATGKTELGRKNAARVLGALGKKDAVPYLISGLKDSYHGVRVESARALGILGDERGYAPLYDSAGRDGDAQVRHAATDAIDKIKAYQEFILKKQEKLDKQQQKL